MDPIRVLIADDDAEMRDALSELIGTDRELDLVAVAIDAEDAIALAERSRPDIALVDVRMPGGGAHATQEIRRRSPATRILALSAYEERGTVLEMVRAGVIGYLVKGSSSASILSSIHRAFAGASVLSSEVTADIMEELASQLRRQRDAEMEDSERVERVRNSMRPGALTPVFQPIVELESGDIVGWEALTRFVRQSVPPDASFAEATAVGLGPELETVALNAAVDVFDSFSSNAFLSLNASPGAAVTSGFADAVCRVPAERVVIEVTEHVRIDDYDMLLAAVADMRVHGARLAVDDAGAGFASLRHILRLSPDFIKLDISLTQGVHRVPAQRALAAALISFAREIDAEIIAEGVEEQADLEALRRLGARYGQGYLLGRPRPAASARTA